MPFISKKTSLLLLIVISILCSRVLFFLFNDPEGPNLVVVIGAAAIMYFISLIAYLLNISDLKRLVVAILIQVLLVIGFSIGLN